MPQSGEPAEPPEGQDEPSAGPVPRQHQEAPKLTGPGKGISGVRTSVWFVGYIQTLPLINLHVRVCVNVPLSRQDLGYKSLSPQQSADVLTFNKYHLYQFRCYVTCGVLPKVVRALIEHRVILGRRLTLLNNLPTSSVFPRTSQQLPNELSSPPLPLCHWSNYNQFMLSDHRERLE